MLNNAHAGTNTPSGDNFGKNYWSIGLSTPKIGANDHESVCIATIPNHGYSSEGMTYTSYVVNGVTSYPVSIYTRTDTDSRSGSTTTETTTGTYTPVDVTVLTLPLTYGRAFYAAMSMEWVEEDNETLSPQWPTLTSDVRLPTLMPGESRYINSGGEFDNKGTGRKPAPLTPPPSMPNKIAIPVIATLAWLLALCLGALLVLRWRGWRTDRQAKRSSKTVDDDLGIPMDAEGGSTAHLNGQAEEDMELREREAAR